MENETVSSLWSDFDATVDIALKTKDSEELQKWIIELHDLSMAIRNPHQE